MTTPCMQKVLRMSDSRDSYQSDSGNADPDVTFFTSAASREAVAALWKLKETSPVFLIKVKLFFAVLTGLMIFGVWTTNKLDLEEPLPLRILMTVMLGGLLLGLLFLRGEGIDQPTIAKIRKLAIRNLTSGQLIIDAIEARTREELLDPAMRGKTPMFTDLSAAPFNTVAERLCFLCRNYCLICYNRGLNFEHSHFKFEELPANNKWLENNVNMRTCIVIQALIDILEGRIDNNPESQGDDMQ